MFDACLSNSCSRRDRSHPFQIFRQELMLRNSNPALDFTLRLLHDSWSKTFLKEQLVNENYKKTSTNPSSHLSSPLLPAIALYLTHPSTFLNTHSPLDSPTYILLNPFIHLPTYSFTHTLTYSHSPTHHSLPKSLTHPLYHIATHQLPHHIHLAASYINYRFSSLRSLVSVGTTLITRTYCWWWVYLPLQPSLYRVLHSVIVSLMGTCLL